VSRPDAHVRRIFLLVSQSESHARKMFLPVSLLDDDDDEYKLV
jgi:hypothetical protein